MHPVLDVVAREGLNTLVTEIYARQPVTDPHVMCMGIGDVAYDQAPLQGTQFEADIRIQQQLELLYLEGGGGGNNYESYGLAWYWAAHRTLIECWTKRQKKGFLFTVGDEHPTPSLQANDIRRVLGKAPDGETYKNWAADKLLAEVSNRWDVFHVTLANGNYAKDHLKDVKKSWGSLLGANHIVLQDHHRLAETIVSAMQVREGVDPAVVAGSWTKPGVSAVVAEAVVHIKPRGISFAGSV